MKERWILKVAGEMFGREAWYYAEGPDLWGLPFRSKGYVPDRHEARSFPTKEAAVEFAVRLKMFEGWEAHTIEAEEL